MPEDDPLDVLDARAPEPDEIDEVLDELRALMGKVTSPVVRSCLEEAHDDIAHLSGKDGEQGSAV
jgi:hypothetical protein